MDVLRVRLEADREVSNQCETRERAGTHDKRAGMRRCAAGPYDEAAGAGRCVAGPQAKCAGTRRCVADCGPILIWNGVELPGSRGLKWRGRMARCTLR